MAEIAELLKLWQNRRRASADVKRIAQRHVADLDPRMAAMAVMRNSLRNLVDCCQGDQRPDCPILEELSGHEVAIPLVGLSCRRTNHTFSSGRRTRRSGKRESVRQGI